MWDRINTWFKDSETIVWARLQMFVGAVWTVLVSIDMAPLIPAKWLTVWLVVSGIVTEVARRSRAEDMK